MAGRTAMLLYHDLPDPEARDTVGFSGAAARRYKLSPADFDATPPPWPRRA